MRDKRIASGLILILGIIGTFVAVLSIPDVALKYTAFAGCLLISITALYFFISAYIDIGTAFRNLKAIKELKVHRLYTDGASANERIRVAVREAKTIRIIVVSGEGLVKVLKNEIIYALQKNAASIRVLLATANSDFVSDVEESESIERIGNISPEIRKVESMLIEYLREAKLSATEHGVIGQVKLAHYRTHLRNSIILCDNSWGWLTLNLPPIRAVQSPSFELKYAHNSLFTICSQHFEKTWDLMNSKDNVKQIAIQPLQRSGKARPLN